jgi:hypothetical protein
VNLVIDASVLVKAFIPESGSEEAGSLLVRKKGGTLPVFFIEEQKEGHFPYSHENPVSRGNVMDEDLNQMTREELIEEVKKLRQGIRQHRDSSRHELCWHHPALWGLLPEKTDPIPVVPEWPEFIRGCVRYRQSLDEQAPNAPRTKEPYKE